MAVPGAAVVLLLGLEPWRQAVDARRPADAVAGDGVDDRGLIDRVPSGDDLVGLLAMALLAALAANLVNNLPATCCRCPPCTAGPAAIVLAVGSLRVVSG